MFQYKDGNEPKYLNDKCKNSVRKVEELNQNT